MITRTRLTTDQKMRALALIARGDTLSQVAGHLLENYNITISESALSQLKKQHKDTLEKMREDIAEGQTAEADAIARRARRMLNVRLDRAERDGRTIEELDRQWRDGEIKDKEDYRKRKAGLLNISIKELVHVSQAMHRQAMPDTPPPPGAPALPAGHPAATPQHLEAMLQAITAGNTVELQRLVFTPGVRHDTPITVQN
jgi:hypothetical protein